MTLDLIHGALLWCSVINFGMLLVWYLFFKYAHDFVYRQHKEFNLSVESFNVIHYTGMAFFKMLIIVFNIVPYIALLIAKK